MAEDDKSFDTENEAPNHMNPLNKIAWKNKLKGSKEKANTIGNST